MSLCSKPGCGRAGAVLLSYEYAERRATLLDSGEGEPSPHLYVMCTPCAEKLRPPRGWTLQDKRLTPSLFLDAARERDAAAAAREEARPQVPAKRQLFFGHSA